MPSSDIQHVAMLPPASFHVVSSATQRPIKLRAACNLCCAAKVKCSGEKNGCQRCRAGGNQCVYVESRVGKVQGARGKRKQPHAQAPRPANTNTNSNANANRVGSGNSNGNSHTSVNSNGNGNAVNYSVIAPASPSPSQESTTYVDADQDDLFSWGSDLMDPSDISAMEFNLQELLQAPAATNMPPKEPPPPQQSMPLSLGLKPRSEQDSQCVLECCRIISDLENYIVTDLRSFKILLGIVREALNSQVMLIGLQQGSRNLRCLFLFSTILYQILEMLEACVVSVRRDSATAQGFPLTPGSSGLGLSQLGFGCLGMDPEEQMEWRMRLISKEVNHAIEVLKKLKALSGIGPDEGGCRDSDVAKSREHCYADLELRLQDLSARTARAM